MDPLHSALVQCRRTGMLADGLIDGVSAEADRKALGLAAENHGLAHWHGASHRLHAECCVSLRTDACRWLRAVAIWLEPSELLQVVRDLLPHASALWTHKPPYFNSRPNPPYGHNPEFFAEIQRGLFRDFCR